MATETAAPRQLASPEPAVVRRRWLERGLLAVLLLGTGVALSANKADADLWGHILFGLETIAAGGPHHHATHTYTGAGHPWVNHENLSEIALAVVHHFGGGQGLLLVKLALGLLIVGSMINLARKRGVSIPTICVVMLTVAINLTAGWSLRPQLFTYTALATLVLLLDAAFADWNAKGTIHMRWLWCTVPLMMVWANAHGGFLAGYGLLMLYLMVRAFQAGLRDGLAAWRTVLRLALVLSIGALSTLLTPYGPLMHRWIAGAMSQPPAEITEWARLVPGTNGFWPAILLMVLVAASLAGTTRRRDPAQILLIVVAACQAISHARHVPLLAILVGYWIPTHCESLLARVRHSLSADGGRSQDIVMSRSVFALCGGLLATACLVLGGVLVQRTQQLNVDRGEFPVAAIEYMANRGLNGRMVVTYNWAQYALVALPNSPVGFDGRFDTCYPQSVLDAHFDFVLGDHPDLRTRPIARRSARGSARDPAEATAQSSAPITSRGTLALELGSPQLALVDRRQPHSTQRLSEHPDWVLLYQDQMAQVWGRKSRFADPASLDYIPPSSRMIGDDAQQGMAQWPALPAQKITVRQTAGNFPPLRLPARKGDT
ncbi:MAG: hypothetical protein K8T91_16875 [Planctomycetes bacterium]|nr:hypothetical protein [Planctomycetota bacterium]